MVKFVAEYNNIDAWELERFTYKLVKTSIRLELLKRLLEAQFDYNTKFKAEVNAFDATSLRILPIGRDVLGNQYWYQLDEDVNFRVYKEQIDDDKSWTLVCQSRQELVDLIDRLKTQDSMQPVKEESSANVSESEDSNPIPEATDSKAQIVKDETEVKSPGIDSKSNNLVTIKSEKSENAKIDQITDLLNDSTSLNSTILKSEKHDLLLDNKPQLHKGLIQSNNDDIVKDVVSKLVEAIDSSHRELPPPLILQTPSASVESNNVHDDSPIDDPNDAFDIRELVHDVLDKVIQQEFEDKYCGKKVARGRGRSRGRGRGRGRGARGASINSGASTPRPSPSPANGVRKRGFGLSRELMELNGLSEQELLINQEDDDMPTVRQSRRIKQIQEKKMSEMAEKMKREQERMEQEAKRRGEIIKQREHQRDEFQRRLENGKDGSYQVSSN